MLGVFLAPAAVLFELDLAGHKLFVLAAPVVYALASTAGEFYEFILGHIGLN